MRIERHVKQFRNGIERPVTETTPKQSLLELLASWQPLAEEFPEIPDLKVEPVKL